MHANSLRDIRGDIPTEYRDQVHRLTIALLRAYNDSGAAERAGKYLADIQRHLDGRKAEQ